jgi:leucyl/phenylalanyl-tRNA--protein transferase
MAEKWSYSDPADVDHTGQSLPNYFPSPWSAPPDFPICIGGDLRPDLLLDAYRHGIFPWPTDEDSPVGWWSPDPRAVIEWDNLHVPRRLIRTIRSGRFVGTANRDFGAVIRSCAAEHSRNDLTWITPNMIAAYERLHMLGYAHSIEVWHSGQLAGGTYGVAVGGLFAAESMFHRVSDASKVALVYLVKHLQARGYQLLDIQQWTPHTGRFGAIELPRSQYLQRLAKVVDLPVSFGESLQRTTD